MIKTILLCVAAYCVGTAFANRDIVCTASPDAARNVAASIRGHVWQRTNDPTPLSGTWRSYP